MAHLLVVDDEEKIRSLIQKYAQHEGYFVTQADDGLSAVELCLSQEFDLIIMDIMMPQMDGFTAVRELRKSCSTPVIMLSARGEEYDKIHGFELGIDDYVVKPFSPKELMLRVRAVLRRVDPAVGGEVYEKDGLCVDFAARRVTVDCQTLDLSPKEYELLFYMVRNRGIAITRDKFICDIWGYDFDGDDRTLDTHIKVLRKNLGLYSHLIVTLRGVGYRFEG